MIKLNDLNFTPRFFPDLFYRKDWDGTMVLHGKGEVCYLSTFSASFFELLFENPIMKAVSIISREYSYLDTKDIIKKAVYTLSFLENNGILINMKGWINMIDGMYIVGEEEYKFLSDYCLDILEKKPKYVENTFMPSYEKSYYELRNLRNICFTSLETVFISVNNFEINSCIFIGGTNKGVDSCTVDGIIFSDKKNMSQLFDFVIEKLRLIGVNKLKYTSLDINEQVLIMLTELGFKYETKLIKEIRNQDLHVYSLFL